MAKEKKELDRFDTKSRRNVPIVVKLLSVIIASVIVSVVGVALLTGIEMSRVPEMVIASKKVLFGKVKILAGLFLFRNNPEKFIFVI